MESWFSSIRLLRDAVVVEILGVLTQLSGLGRRAHHMTMQHSARRRRLRPIRRALAATGPVTANSSLWSLRGSEFEQRVTPSFSEVILLGVVDAYAVSA